MPKRTTARKTKRRTMTVWEFHKFMADVIGIAEPGAFCKLDCGAYRLHAATFKLVRKSGWRRRHAAVAFEYSGELGAGYESGAHVHGVQVLAGGRMRRVQLADGVVDLHLR